MKKIITFITFVTLSQSAAALNCHSGSGLMGYNSGYSSQAQLLDFYWNQNPDCFHFDSFVDAIDVPLATPSSSTYLRCYTEGSNDALARKIDNVVNECQCDATESGYFRGQAAAKVFCRVNAIAKYEGLFSDIYRQSCQASFTSYVQTFCPQKLNTSEFAFVRGASCDL